MNYEHLLLEKKDGIATITLNAPEKRNPMTPQLKVSLPLAVDEVSKDDDVRVVIVTGAGSAFSAGGDIDNMKARFSGTLKETLYQRLSVLGEGWGDVFVKTDKPVIAAINGAAVGAGLSLALSCDIRIASDRAKFGSLFILRALVPDCGTTYFLPRTVGTSKALEMMYTGEVIDATEAERLGIISRVVPHDELMNVAQELATRIAQQPPIAIQLTKRLVYRSMINDLAHHLDWETYGQQVCFDTEDHRESVRAFLEKKPQPPFTGK